MPWLPVLVGVAASGLMAGISSATTPDVAAPVLDNGEGAKAELATLPARRAIDSAAQQGRAVSVATGRQVEGPKTYTVSYKQGGTRGDAPWQTFTGTQAEIDAAKAKGGALDGMVVGQQRWDGKTNMVDEILSPDFTGSGDAEVQAKIAKQMAAKYLELGDKYGTQFVDEAKKQLELADPEGTAARKQLYDLIVQQADAKPERPVADLLDKQISEAVASGNRMNSSAANTLAGATAAANADRGDALSRALLQRQMESGAQGQARADASRQKALGWLTSGATPEDTQYRRDQQDLSNYSSFTAGVTPTAQFASLSGAQQGATPLATGKALPTANPNADATANAFGLQGWQAKQSAAMQQSGAWPAGLSSLLTGAGTIVAATK